MKEANYGSVADVKIIDSPSEVAILYNLTYLTVLQSIVARARPASEIAADTEMTLDRVLYRLRVLTKAGLVQVVFEQPRSGRPMKYYRAVAKTFFAPAQATVELSMGGWRDHRQLRSLLDRIVTNLLPTIVLDRYGIDGELVSFSPEGTIERSVGYFAGEEFTKLPPHLMEDKRLSYGEFMLTREGARVLVDDIGNALTRAMTDSQSVREHEKKYLYSVVVALAPTQPE